MPIKIGQLARQTGLTVRTLHHYDAIGLLSPSGRAENGYRMYDCGDVTRLYQIQALRRLGMNLEEVGVLLAGESIDVGTIVAKQITQLNSQIEHATLLRGRLMCLQEDFAAAAKPDLQEWLTTLELMTLFDKHLTPDEIARWRTHAQNSRGGEAKAWKALIEHIHGLIRTGVPPDAQQAQNSARRWMELLDPHVKRSPQLVLKMDALYRNELELQVIIGHDHSLLEYMGHAASHYRLSLYARHLDPIQLDTIRERYLHQPNGDWIVVCRDLCVLMDRGVSPDDPAVLALCLRWRCLFADCFSSDPDIQARILHALANDPLLALGSIWSTPLYAYLQAGLKQLEMKEMSYA